MVKIKSTHMLPLLANFPSSTHYYVSAGVVTVAEVIEEGEAAESRSPTMMLAEKLIDNYLSKIASMIFGHHGFHFEKLI